jgi:hypothetical protein
MVHSDVPGMADVTGQGKIMVIIQMSGGLGNQMFQYALFLKLRSLGRDVRFDDITTYTMDNARPIQLAVFGIRYPRASKQELTEMTDGSLRLADRIRRKFTGRLTKEYDEKGLNYDPLVLEQDPAYLVGLFQSERYFADISDKVRKAFTFDSEVFTPEMLSMEKKIKASAHAVSIHVRRGDYLAAETMYGDICTDAYYDAAIDLMHKRYPDAVFYLFTNDSEWADFFRARRNDAAIEPVRCSEEYTGYLDMYLMTCCRHHIIANSSFSWWGAWLCDAADKDVIAPSRWLNADRCMDIHTDNMTLIDSEGRIQKD